MDSCGADQRIDEFSPGQQEILEAIAAGTPLDEVFDSIIEFVTAHRSLNNGRDAADPRLTNIAAHLARVAIASDRHRHGSHRARVQQSAREEQLRSVIFDSVGDAIFYMREEPEGYRFVSVNRAFTELFGVSGAELSGRLLHEVLPDATREATLDRYCRAALTGDRQRWDEVIAARTGEKHAEITIIPLPDDGGSCTNFVGTVHDVTMRVPCVAPQRSPCIATAHVSR